MSRPRPRPNAKRGLLAPRLLPAPALAAEFGAVLGRARIRRPTGPSARLGAFRWRRVAVLLAGLVGLALLAFAFVARLNAGSPAVEPLDRSASPPASVLAPAVAQPFAPFGSPPPAETKQRVSDAYGRLPLSFIPNVGQTDRSVRYLTQGPGYSFFFTERKAVLAFSGAGAKATDGMALELRFLGASPQATLEPGRRAPGTVNRFAGNDPSKWRTGVATYDGVVYRQLWPGIDMRFSGTGERLKYEFRLRPGADPRDIRLAYAGASGLSVGAGGALAIDTPRGILKDSAPVAYQRVGGRRVPVESSYAVNGSAYGFALGAYDPRHPLVVDPGLLYSTYLGGSGDEQGLGIAVDAAGSAYVTGNTGSANFPTTPGAFDTSFNGGNIDAFVTKLNATGSALAYSTYLGGSSPDGGRGIAVDAAGSAYVTGFTSSVDLPTTPGAFDTSFNGNNDAFVTKLDATGSALLYSTYLGGSPLDRDGRDEGFGIAVDGAGSAYVTGFTRSFDFPTTPGAYSPVWNPFTGGGQQQAFVTKLNATGSALAYSTFLGGIGGESGEGIAVDGAGSAYLTGQGPVPTTAGAFDTSDNGTTDAFVTKLNPTGSALVYSTLLGGIGAEKGHGIALDAAGSAYVTGFTTSVDFPTTPGAFDTSFNGNDDVFVTKLDATGSALAYSTYLGASGRDQGNGIALDGAGGAYVTGFTGSGDFPTTAGAFDTSLASGDDAFVTKLNAAGSALAYSTYLGGGGCCGERDAGFGIAVDGAGSAYVTGETGAGNFPTTPGAFDTSYNGGGEAFVTKLDLGGTPATLTLTPATDTNTIGTPHTVTATVRDLGGNPVSGVTVRFTVSGANSASGADVTDANGQADFTYSGTNPGTDTILAFADTDNDGTNDVGEPSGTATKVWTPGAPASLTLAPATDTNTAGDEHCVTATVEDASGNPVPDVKVFFSVSGANSASGTDTTDANGEAEFCYTGTNAGADAITAVADADGDDDPEATEPTGVATKTYTPAAPATLTLAPKADTNDVDSEHCVTATVKDAFGNPTPGVTVRFTVTGSVNTSGSRTTDASGEAEFCYQGPELPGADAISAFADTDNDDTQDAGEPSDTAAKAWVLPVSTPLCKVEITNGGRITADNGDKATFGGNAKVSELGIPTGDEQYRDHGPAQPLRVKSTQLLALVCPSDTQASVFGRATIDGSGSHLFRIDVQDLGEPGRGADTYRILLDAGYDSGAHTLEGGNVQIHKE